MESVTFKISNFEIRRKWKTTIWRFKNSRSIQGSLSFKNPSIVLRQKINKIVYCSKWRTYKSGSCVVGKLKKKLKSTWLRPDIISKFWRLYILFENLWHCWTQEEEQRKFERGIFVKNEEISTELVTFSEINQIFISKPWVCDYYLVPTFEYLYIFVRS